ncbi:MAG: malonate decarboxylase acyl carrier protein [Pseudomonadota bacterium]
MNTMHSNLETLHFSYAGGRAVADFRPVLAGVVGSGNLEVMIAPAGGAGCQVRVETSARGFGEIWAAVLQDFCVRHSLTGVLVSINDMGATPAVVSLRLDQAVAELLGECA